MQFPFGAYHPLVSGFVTVPEDWGISRSHTTGVEIVEMMESLSVFLPLSSLSPLPLSLAPSTPLSSLSTSSLTLKFKFKLNFKQLYWHDRSCTVFPKQSVTFKTTTTTTTTKQKETSLSFSVPLSCCVWLLCSCCFVRCLFSCVWLLCSCCLCVWSPQLCLTLV